MIIGIDDAGRGPVLGPMILAGVMIEEQEQKELETYGAKDSKQLTPNNRARIGTKIKERFQHYITKSTPKEIDESTNLNYLEAIKTAMIINKLSKQTNKPITAIIDCPSTNITSWSEDVRKLLQKKEQITLRAEHKADANHAIVGAASILAKEEREKEMNKLRATITEDIGSGYPSDPTTKEFIKNHHNNKKYQDIIRHSWKTVKKLVTQQKLL